MTVGEASNSSSFIILSVSAFCQAFSMLSKLESSGPSIMKEGSLITSEKVKKKVMAKKPLIIRYGIGWGSNTIRGTPRDTVRPKVMQKVIVPPTMAVGTEFAI